MNFDQSDKALEQRVGTLEQMLGQLLAEQMAANANGGGAAGGMNVPVMPIIGGSGGACVFQLDGNTVGKGAYFVARRFVRVTNTTDLGDLSEFTGYISLRYSLGGDTATVITATTVATPSTTSCDYPLYHLTNGVVDEDYRGAPHVQLRE